MCNNNCCMCCQCNNMHDEDNPQEITYTSVCDSDACNNKNNCKRCCCNDGLCEDDALAMVLGLSEKMEECCEEVHDTLRTVECEIEEILRKNIEQDEKLDDLYDREKFDFNKSIFNPTTKKIEFWHVFPEKDGKDPIHYTEWDIDASNFLKDWFVDDVKLISNRYLELTFNVDPATGTHHEPIKITIDLYDFINPSLYYTKSEINTTVSNINNRITNLTNDFNAYKTFVSNTYETKTDGANHFNEATWNPNTRILTLSRPNGLNTKILNITDDNNFVTSGLLSGTVLTLNREGLNPITIDLSELQTVDNDHYPEQAFVDANGVLHLTGTNFTEVTAQLPTSTNTNYYPTEGSVDNNDILTLSSQSNDFPTMTIQLPNYSRTDNDHYVTSGTVDNGVLKLTRNGVAGTVDIQLPAGADGNDNDYVDSVVVTDTQITLGRTGNLPDLTAAMPKSVKNVTVNGTTMTINFTDGTSQSYTIAGDTTQIEQQITNIEGDITNINNDITSIEQRIEALEGLWEINPNNSNQVIAKNNRSAMAAGFYDSTVNL